MSSKKSNRSQNRSQKNKRRQDRKRKLEDRGSGRDSVIPADFRPWLAEVLGLPAVAIEGLVDQADDVLAILAAINVGFNPFAWRAMDVTAFLEVTDELSAVDSQGGSPRQSAQMGMLLWLRFCGDTGKWQGMSSDLANTMTQIESQMGTPELWSEEESDVEDYDDYDDEYQIVDPPEVEAAALKAAPAVARLRRFLDWYVRNGEPGPDALEGDLIDEMIGTVGGDVAEAGLLWAAALVADPGFIARWRERDGRDIDIPTDMMRGVVAAQIASLYEVVVSGDDAVDPVAVDPFAAETLLRTVLISASIGEPTSIEDFADDAQFGGAALRTEVLDRIARLIAESVLVEVDGHWNIAPGMHSAVAEAMSQDDEELLEEILDEAADDDRVLELNVTLEGVSPPVWRRLRVPAGISLELLHHLLQVLFDWDDQHLHEFRITDEQAGIVGFAPRAAIGDRVADYLPEERVAVGLELTEPGDELIYLYDFGDDWVHRIAVEDVIEFPQAEDRLVTCLAGSGRAPLEDSGGVPGWAYRLAAAADPTVADHLETREWLGLAEGQVFDATAFDRTDVNRRIDRLVAAFDAQPE